MVKIIIKKNNLKKNNLKKNNLCFSNEQITFNNFLINNNIKYIHISKSLTHFNRINKIFNLSNYNIKKNIKEPTLFFGMYNKDDKNLINKHKCKKFLIYAGTDCNNIYNKRFNNVLNIKKIKNITYLSISEIIKIKLKEIYNIDSILFELDLVDYNIFYKKQLNNNNKNILIYDGNFNSDDKIYNKKLCDEIENELNNKFNIVRTSKLTNKIEYKNMFNFYEKFFICLRLTEFDGNANTVQEFKAIGKPIIHNQSNYGIKWENKNDIIKNILNISNYIEYQKNYELNIIIDNYISLESMNLLLNIYNKLINNNFNNIKIYCNNKNYNELKKFNYSYIFNINDLNIDNLKNIFFYNDSIYNDIKLKNLNEYFYNINGKNENFIDIQKNYLEQSLDKNIYEENNLYNIIVKKIFEYTKYIKNKFSIIIPLYNSELYIIHTLNSIYHQENINEINLEIIIIDDNSTDNSIKIINEYITNNNINNIKIINNEENKGTYYSRNRGIFHSTGEFVLFLDSDDLLPKSRLIDDYNDFLLNNNIELVCSKYIGYNCDNNYNLKIIDKYINCIYKKISITYKRNFFNKIGFFVDNRFSSDSEFYDRILKNNNQIFLRDRLGYKKLYHELRNEINKYDKIIKLNFKKYYKCCLYNKIELNQIINLLNKNENEKI